MKNGLDWTSVTYKKCCGSQNTNISELQTWIANLESLKIKVTLLAGVKSIMERQVNIELV